MRIQIWGAKNSGKSTLFNKLVGKRISTVSSRPDSTRKPISHPWENLLLIDSPKVEEADRYLFISSCRSSLYQLFFTGKPVDCFDSELTPAAVTNSNPFAKTQQTTVEEYLSSTTSKSTTQYRGPSVESVAVQRCYEHCFNMYDSYIPYSIDITAQVEDILTLTVKTFKKGQAGIICGHRGERVRKLQDAVREDLAESNLPVFVKIGGVQ